MGGGAGGPNCECYRISVAEEHSFIKHADIVVQSATTTAQHQLPYTGVTSGGTDSGGSVPKVIRMPKPCKSPVRGLCVTLRQVLQHVPDDLYGLAGHSVIKRRRDEALSASWSRTHPFQAGLRCHGPCRRLERHPRNFPNSLHFNDLVVPDSRMQNPVPTNPRVRRHLELERTDESVRQAQTSRKVRVESRSNRSGNMRHAEVRSRPCYCCARSSAFHRTCRQTAYNLTLEKKY